MADNITESAIEKFAIELLEKQGYQYICATSIATDGKKTLGILR
jgi:hypothetical protein